MGALISGLLELFQWLAATAHNFFTWLGGLVRQVVGWFLGLAQAVVNLAWDLLKDLLGWLIAFLFWVLGGLVELILVALTALVGLLPSLPQGFHLGAPWHVIVPAFNVANQILPISEAIMLGGIWLTFYGLMALWRAITFLRGGR
ncbi:hypothetical protein [Thermus aquaticus]|jgi:hypothetical protein|uniref:Uncharacterized protein n=1 Tax=Thermus aquaticus (strain ATCC BAA-2747 / Y51MC23) TaxID=498848 RepID=A0ABN4IJE0_THEA5|nr:hypothetical protein [Thermus aquaticus]ALJ91442.1 hypothetical protein TO73_1603 [Thermus aquaticus Y51MC23]